MLIKSRKVVNFSAIVDKKSQAREPEGKNAEKARLVDDFQGTIGYLNFNPPEIKKRKKNMARGIIPRYRQ